MGQKASAEDLRKLLRVARNLRTTAADMREREYADKLVRAAEELEGRAHFLAGHKIEEEIPDLSDLQERHVIDIRC